MDSRKSETKPTSELESFFHITQFTLKKKRLNKVKGKEMLREKKSEQIPPKNGVLGKLSGSDSILPYKKIF